MDLTGQLLIAMPGMGDPRFDRSVVFICTYSDEGAMGIILNKPVPDMRLREVSDRMDMDAAAGRWMRQCISAGLSRQSADLSCIPTRRDCPMRRC